MDDSRHLKRVITPIFWLPFGAGGMLSALFGPVLVFVTGIALPLGWLLSPDYRFWLDIARTPLGKLIALAIIVPFMWHALHRIHHCLHDFGIHAVITVRIICYGIAAAATVATLVALLVIGF